MKKIFLPLLILNCCALSGYTDIDDCKLKQAETAKIISILERSNSIDPKALYDGTAKSIDTSDIKDPYTMAKLVIMAYYVAWPGNAHTIPYDSLFAKYSIRSMLKFKDHKHFADAMALISDGIRLDAGYAEEFDDVVWETRNIPAVRMKFAERIKSCAKELTEHGTPEDKKAAAEELF